MKTYNQQKTENKVRLDWLKRVANEDFGDVIGVLRGVHDWLGSGRPYLDIHVTRLEMHMEAMSFDRGIGYSPRNHVFHVPVSRTVSIEGSILERQHDNNRDAYPTFPVGED